MPLPVLAAGGALASVGGSIATLAGLAGAATGAIIQITFFQWLLRFAWAFATFGFAVAVWIAAYAALYLLLVGIIVPIENPYIRMGFYIVWPPGADVLIATYFAARFGLFMIALKMWAINNVS